MIQIIKYHVYVLFCVYLYKKKNIKQKMKGKGYSLVSLRRRQNVEREVLFIKIIQIINAFVQNLLSFLV